MYGDEIAGMEHKILDALTAWEYICVNLAFCLRGRVAKRGPGWKASGRMAW